MTHESLIALKPCSAGLAFAEKYDTLQAAWDACANTGWMTWYLRHTKNPKMLEVGAACARAVLPIFEKKYPDDKRPRAAVDAADKYLLDGIPIHQKLQSAAAAAAASASASADYASADYAAYAAAAAAASAAYAAYAAYAASAAYAAASYAAASYAADAAYAAASAKIKIPNVIRSIVPKI